jgi:hypothetical protein
MRNECRVSCEDGKGDQRAFYTIAMPVRGEVWGDRSMHSPYHGGCSLDCRALELQLSSRRGKGRAAQLTACAQTKARLVRRKKNAPSPTEAISSEHTRNLSGVDPHAETETNEIHA